MWVPYHFTELPKFETCCLNVVILGILVVFEYCNRQLLINCLVRIRTFMTIRYRGILMRHFDIIHALFEEMVYLVKILPVE